MWVLAPLNDHPKRVEPRGKNTAIILVPVPLNHMPKPLLSKVICDDLFCQLNRDTKTEEVLNNK